jgi:alpha-L-fucosidase
MFIHWGAYSVIGRHEWARDMFQIPQAEYDTYVRQFNPVRFNANDWVSIAQNAGAKYMIITSKHHDGFSIYRSQVSDYDMKLTPYPGDPLKDLAIAARQHGMHLGFYHSIMDWHSPLYIPKRTWEAPGYQRSGNIDRYIEYMKGQLHELLTQYGDVAALWFDGEWEHSTAEMHSDEIYDYIRTLQPNTLINDRLFKREPGNRGDYGTPEQYVPSTGLRDASGKPMLWESCVTINTDSWGYNKYETNFKTSRDLIRMLIEVVSKGGNLLLNVGPRPDGVIQDEFTSRLAAIGRWMHVNSESIYGTTASPFERLPFFGRATVKGNKLYLQVFEWPRDGELRVPGLRNMVHHASLLPDPSSRLNTRRDGPDILISLPAPAPDEVASVVELDLDGPPVVDKYMIRGGDKGVYRLGAESSEILSSMGQRAKKENLLGHVYVTNWTRAKDELFWPVEVAKPGRYKVEISYGAGGGSEGTPFVISAGSESVTGKVMPTGNPNVFKTFPVGTLRLSAGEHQIQIKAEQKDGVAAMNLERITLTRVE